MGETCVEGVEKEGAGEGKKVVLLTLTTLMVQNKGVEDHLVLLDSGLPCPHSSTELQGDLGAVGTPLSRQRLVTGPRL